MSTLKPLYQVYIMFCPSCKTLLRPEKNDDEDVLRCPNCGFEKPIANENRVKPKRVLEDDLKEVPVFEDLDTMPVDDTVLCPKCGNKGAYWHLRQTRAADEATTRFYRCTKCKHTWREYT